MYELKTLLPQFDIQLPTCMYTLNPVSLAADSAAAACGSVGATTTGNVTTFHATTTNSSSANNNNTTTTATLNAPAPVKCVLDLDVLAEQIKQQQIKATASEVGVIVQRQERVLKQLDDLKEQLARIRKTLNLCGKGPQHTNAPQKQQQVTTKSATTTGTNGGLREEPLHDIVINGHPNFIPYALLALKNAWQDLFTINVKTFTHSTLTEGLSEQAREFENLLKSGPVNSSKPKINVTLIWKNCEHTELISSPTMYVPIYGEVNIIRYLGRVGPTEYRYEDSPLCNEIDAVLDICYRLLRCTTPKAKAALLKELSQRLGSQAYFGGDSMSVADIGVHSSLKRMPSITDKMLTPTLREWRKRAQLVTRI